MHCIDDAIHRFPRPALDPIPVRGKAEHYETVVYVENRTVARRNPCNNKPIQ
jgi:hypothetical protein